MNQGSPDEIARRAYSLWETQGRPHGQHREHWEQAERELADANDPVRAEDPPALASEEADAPIKKVTRRATAKAKADEAGAAPKPKRAPRKTAPKVEMA